MVSGVIKIHLNCVANREIRASGFEGPIPSSISVLSDLTDLWVLPSKLFSGSWVAESQRYNCEFFKFKKFNVEELTVIDGATLCRRISDLVGEGSKFPNLSSMIGMSRL